MKSQAGRQSCEVDVVHTLGTRWCRALTLIETLVVLVVLAILLAILLSVLGKARSSGRLTGSIANARTLSQTIVAFSDANRERMPRFEDGVYYPALNRDSQVLVPYWQVANMWTGVIFDFLPYNENISVFLSPGSARRHDYDLVWPTSYHYSLSFVADPQVWTPGGGADPRFLVACRYSDTTFPSQKALLWDIDAAFTPSPSRSPTGDLITATPVAMADLAVSVRSPASATAPFVNPFPAPGAAMRLHNTPSGQRGSDY